MKLDKSKPYEEIMGSTDGSKYAQNGNIFDSQGIMMYQPEVAQEVKTERPKLGRPPKTF